MQSALADHNGTYAVIGWIDDAESRPAIPRPQQDKGQLAVITFWSDA